MYKLVFWSIRDSNAASETAGGSISVLLNPGTFLAKQVSPCIPPLLQVTLKSPTETSSALNFFWLRACQAELSTLFRAG